MKKLILKGILVTSILGIGAISFNFVDYAGIPTQHAPERSATIVAYDFDTVSPNLITIQGIPTQH